MYRHSRAPRFVILAPQARESPICFVILAPAGAGISHHHIVILAPQGAGISHHHIVILAPQGAGIS